MEVTDCIECPKCHKPFLKSCGTNSQFGKEYFCHFCHEYFGVNELVNQWNYDAGDLYPPYPVTHGNYKNWIPKGNHPMIVDIDYVQEKVDISWVGLCTTYPADGRVEHTKNIHSEFDNGEPYWATGYERKDAYQMVSRMLLGISEIDDYTDVMNTYADALDIGVQ